MPSLQQSSSFKDCSISDLNGSDILQKQSINSLLEQNETILQNDESSTQFKDIFCNLTTTPTSVKGSLSGSSNGSMTMFGSYSSNQSPMTKNSFVDSFQTDNFSSQQSLGFDSITSPTTPSTPGSSKAFHSFQQIGGSDSSVSRSSLESSGFLNNLSRSNSPLMSDSNIDVALPNNDSQNLSDLMNFLHLNQQPNQQHIENQYQRENLSQLQALQMHFYQQQQLNHQLNLMPIQQLFTQQILNQVQQLQQNMQRPSQEGILLDQAAKFYRSSASLRDASCTWSGMLPCRPHKFITYSPKVFLGGIPWDISEQTLMQILKPFGQIRIEWPGKEHNTAQPKGYVYVIFESEKQVKQLLQACSVQDASHYASSEDSSSTSVAINGNYYYKISSKRMREKDVEVIPWIIEDSNYIRSANQKLESNKTVFVGALHGKLTAEALAKIMNDLFDGVVYAGIDTDKHKYPIGSGRVTFNNTRSYMRAVSAAFIEIKTSRFSKKVQVDPYLEDALCSVCGVQHGPYYCRELTCFRYFCRQCWQSRHMSDAFLRNHKPLTRNSKTQTLVGVGPGGLAGCSTQMSNFNASRYSSANKMGMKNPLNGFGSK